jgi:hypothetical protein
MPLTKHTPGPWSARLTGTAPYHRVCNENGEQVCGCNWIKDEAEANARLIAAAPTMQDAITYAGRSISDIMDGFEPGTPVWTALQKIMMGLYGSLPKAQPEEAQAV